MCSNYVVGKYSIYINIDKKRSEDGGYTRTRLLKGGVILGLFDFHLHVPG